MESRTADVLVSWAMTLAWKILLVSVTQPLQIDVQICPAYASCFSAMATLISLNQKQFVEKLTANLQPLTDVLY
jgi:hypothetical protein